VEQGRRRYLIVSANSRASKKDITMRTLIAIVALGGLATAASAATPAPKAKLTLVQARAIALKAAPGRVTKGEYEKEKGSWRYSFDIRQGRMNHEVGVDANTGRIVESVVEPLGKAD